MTCIYVYVYISPDSVCINSPLSALQIFKVSSSDPDTTLVPSPEKATEFTAPVWPDKRYMSNKTNIIIMHLIYKIHVHNIMV